jgi:hypothetical protein
VNARRTPRRILCDHLKDQIPDLLRQLLPSHSPSGPGDQTPVQAKTCTMPADDRLRIDEHERLLPSTPETTSE